MGKSETIEAERVGQVRSVTRALSILRKLAVAEAGLTLTEISERVSLPPSTTHRLLTTLEAERFVRFDTSAGLWRIGVASFLVGSSFARTRDLLQLAKPYLRRLTEMTGETSNIFVESDGQIICMDQVESHHTMRAITQIGGRIRMHASAAGKTLLAHMRPERRAHVVAMLGLPALTPNTITSRDALTRDLAVIAGRGVGFDDEEHALGLRCVAAPIVDEAGHAVAAVSVSGPSGRLVDDRLQNISQHVSRIASEITLEYGGRPG
ncbi:MAG: IclR family transcriptional regulator C-terminal domain-containing protein [Pseudomonadota bacterium]